METSCSWDSDGVFLSTTYVQEGEGSSVGLFYEGCFKAGGNGGMELGIDDNWIFPVWGGDGVLSLAACVGEIKFEFGSSAGIEDEDGG
ncbi:hypothetical protein NC651_030492 [Populus alba x Populus x berolinensis]|nr:hypothetical protein NC651_030492 [Populus alba x Populus x berolinensis]